MKSESLGQRRSVRKPKTFHNFVFPASIGERLTRGPSCGCEPSIFLNGFPIGLLEKKLCSIMCCHFLVPIFDSKKVHLFKKKSSRDDFFKTVETRRKFTLKSLYFWNRVSTVLKKPSRLDFFLKFSDRVKSRIFLKLRRCRYVRNVGQCGSRLAHVMTACRGDRFRRHNFSPVDVSFTFLISPASGIKI